MVKRKLNRKAENRIKKQRSEEDAKLSQGLFSNASKENDWDNEEQEYELQPRSLKAESTVEEGLPIKRADGKIERVMRTKEIVEEPEELEEPEIEEPEEPEEPESEEEPLQINQLKEEVSEIAGKLIEDPEEHIGLLSRLRKMAESKNPITSRLSLLALVPIFKSIAPSYRIRPLSDTERREKVSKEVQRLRIFEEGLVSNYKSYIALLAELSKNGVDKLLERHCINAACELAVSLRFFNFRTEVIAIIVRRAVRMNSGSEDAETFRKCISTLETLLSEDASSGDVSFDVVRTLSKSLRARKYRVDESVVNVLLSLSLLADYDPEGVQEEKEKLKKKDRVHLSKKERKNRKERKLIEEEMRKAEQAVSADERERYQAQVLRMLLSLYLDMLKSRPEQLMAPVLEGLARYGHMANLDLLGDFVEVLSEISTEILSEQGQFMSSNHVRQVLLCVVTSFALYSTHSNKVVHLDLSRFVNTLYKMIPLVAFDADIEFSHRSLRLADPLTDKKPSVNVSTKIELLLRALDSVFFLSKSGSSSRATAFAKRIYMSMLHVPEKSSIAMIKFAEKLMGRYSEVAGLYATEDRVANGVFRIEVDDPVGANADAATLWENTLLDRHYCPAVSQGVRAMLNKSKAIGR